MEEPKILLYSWEAPKTALTMLGANKRKAAFVVDKSRRLLGVIKESSLQKFVDSGEKSNGIPDSVLRKVPTVTEDTILEDMFSIISENPWPVPVVNEEGKLKGIVTTDQIFESISPAEGEDHV